MKFYHSILLSLPYSLSAIFFLTLFAGCGLSRIDPMHFLIRSDRITSFEQEQQVMQKARLEWIDGSNIRVLYVAGTPYERGYQQGKLLREEVQENLGALYTNSLKTFHSEELFAEVYERLRPFIPQEYIDEMQGLAHGSRMPLHVIHAIHALPSLTEWGGKRRIKGIVKQMMKGELGTSCSNVGALPDATRNHEMYVIRILDWGLHRISRLHDYPLITIHFPEEGEPSANIGWVGFLGAVSGMNASGITLGEMGYGSPPNETLRGKPMIFLLRDILTYSHNLKDVRSLITSAPGTNAFSYLMSDGKSLEAELYYRDRDTFRVFRPGEEVYDDKKQFPGVRNLVYGGHFDELMSEVLTRHSGNLTRELFMEEIIPEIAMKSNFQNVIYEPQRLAFWVSNSPGKSLRAAEAPYFFFDLKKAISDHIQLLSTFEQD